MKIFLTFLFALTLSSAFTQTDWSPFPENQQTRYAENDKIFQYYNDSTLQTGTEKTHFFGLNYRSRGVFRFQERVETAR